MPKKTYKRVLLKISGEALQGSQGFGYDPDAVKSIVERIKPALDAGIQIALVVGAGNIWRGAKAASKTGMDRVSADHMGMLATTMNAICLRNAFLYAGIDCTVHAAVDMQPFAKRYDRDGAIAELNQGKLVIFAAGTGLPYFTTDTSSALRALEIKCQALLKATKVNGVYTSDPKKDKSAKRFDRISFDEVLKRRLGVMDASAFALCADNALHIIIFDFDEPDALLKVLSGDTTVGTVVS